MNLRLSLTPGTTVTPILNAKKDVVGFDITPFFASPKATAIPIHGESVNRRGEVLDRFVLTVSGSKGKVTQRKYNSAVPSIDAPTPAEDKEDDTDDSTSVSDTKRS